MGDISFKMVTFIREISKMVDPVDRPSSNPKIWKSLVT